MRFLLKRTRKYSMPNIKDLCLRADQKDSDLKPQNRMLEGLDIDGWDKDKFFKQYVEDEEVTDFATGKRKLIMANRAGLIDERANEIARLVADKRIICLFTKVKELVLQRREKEKVVALEDCSLTPKRKISPNPPTPMSKGRRCSIQESSPILRSMSAIAMVGGIQGIRRCSVSGVNVKRKKHVAPRRRIKSTSMV